MIKVSMSYQEFEELKQQITGAATIMQAAETRQQIIRSLFNMEDRWGKVGNGATKKCISINAEVLAMLTQEYLAMESIKDAIVKSVPEEEIPTVGELRVEPWTWIRDRLDINYEILELPDVPVWCEEGSDDDTLGTHKAIYASGKAESKGDNAAHKVENTVEDPDTQLDNTAR